MAASKFTKDEKQAILKENDDGLSYKDLGIKHNVSGATISNWRKAKSKGKGASCDILKDAMYNMITSGKGDIKEVVVQLHIENAELQNQIIELKAKLMELETTPEPA